MIKNLKTLHVGTTDQTIEKRASEYDQETPQSYTAD